jgi:branched-chain amino acid transport system permease protein
VTVRASAGLAWAGAALLLAVLPLVFRQGFALTLLSQMGIMVIFALSYNMLFGQTGLLSFGHAVYSGLGAYVAIHALQAMGDGRLPLPVTLLPLVGGFAGALFGVVFGWVSTRRAGTVFAMISLGIGEMVAASALMLPGFFGGEGGITADRVVGRPVLGITYGPAIQVYYLIAAWTLVSAAAMYALTRTPLGRIANAVRDNPERAEFIGYDARVVRFLMFVLAAFFAGVAGGLAAINFEIVNAESVGLARSGGVLLATYIGGAGAFLGPVLGAVVYTFFVLAVSGWTKAWLLYLGLFFIGMVLYAPGGLAGLLGAHVAAWRAGALRALVKPYLGAAAAALVALAGFVLLVESLYHAKLEAAGDARLVMGPFAFDVGTATPWVLAAVLIAAGGVACRPAFRRVAAAWDAVQPRLAPA